MADDSENRIFYSSHLHLATRNWARFCKSSEMECWIKKRDQHTRWLTKTISSAERENDIWTIFMSVEGKRWCEFHLDGFNGYKSSHVAFDRADRDTRKRTEFLIYIFFDLLNDNRKLFGTKKKVKLSPFRVFDCVCACAFESSQSS